MTDNNKEYVPFTIVLDGYLFETAYEQESAKDSHEDVRDCKEQE